jgi:hypothetical protein
MQAYETTFLLVSTFEQIIRFPLNSVGTSWNVYRVLTEKPEGKNHLEDQNVDGRMGSERILGRLAGGV